MRIFSRIIRVRWDLRSRSSLVVWQALESRRVRVCVCVPSVAGTSLLGGRAPQMDRWPQLACWNPYLLPSPGVPADRSWVGPCASAPTAAAPGGSRSLTGAVSSVAWAEERPSRGGVLRRLEGTLQAKPLSQTLSRPFMIRPAPPTSPLARLRWPHPTVAPGSCSRQT